MISTLHWPLVALAVAATAMVTWFAVGEGWTLAGSAGADPDNAAQVELGQQIYATSCASCHGADLEGQPNWKSPLADGGMPAPPHDETGHTWHHPDELLFDYTKRGGSAVIGGNFVSNMPGFGDQLSDEEIWAVIAFIKSRWPLAIQQRHAERSRG